MGMDGLSMANTGALKESTSADLTSRTEQIVQADPTNNSKQVQTTSTNRAIREKEEEEDSSKKQQQQKKEEQDIQDEFVESKSYEEVEDFHIEDLENPNKDFYVKLNIKNDIIELYDSSTDRLIETISGNELQELVLKLNMASGIFVNKKV